MNLDIKNIIKDMYLNDECATIEKVSQGYRNFNFKVTGQSCEYFVKAYRDIDIEHIESEIKLIEAATTNGVNIPQIISTKDGRKLYLENNYAIVVSEFVAGIKPEISEKNCSLIGKQVAKLHSIPAQNYLRKEYKTNPIEISQRIDNYSNASTYEIKKYKDSINLVLKNLTPSREKCVIHTDIFLDNCVLKNEEIYLIDFEEVIHGDPMFDIGRALLGCCSEDSINFTAVTAFLNAYQSIRPLTKDEFENIYYWFVYGVILSIDWRYIEFNVRRPNEGRNKLYKQFNNVLYELINISNTDFINRINY